MFTTMDNRVLFEVAGQIAQLGVNVREFFSITKVHDGRRDSPVTWEVARLTEPPNGPFVVPRPASPRKGILTDARVPEGNLRSEGARKGISDTHRGPKAK